MNFNRSSLGRDAVGFFAGALLAAIAAGLVFVAFFPLPKEHDPRNHTGEAFMMTVLVMFFCGGFVGRCGFSAEALSDLLPSVIGTYVVVVLLPLVAGLSFGEIMPFLGFASAGIAASVAGSLLLLRRFPLEAPNAEG
jgi:drug/metabolite transporter (DMT)-like permease